MRERRWVFVMLSAALFVSVLVWFNYSAILSVVLLARKRLTAR